MIGVLLRTSVRGLPVVGIPFLVAIDHQVHREDLGKVSLLDIPILALRAEVPELHPLVEVRRPSLDPPVTSYENRLRVDVEAVCRVLTCKQALWRWHV